ncbi:mitochondrial import inner membrane translocase subunit tim21 [Sporothrix curviconia]|uniref:Mitochondrial import inner membrane translocase subunit Tim21 n=1 Tax=Sporothrix curviconia TaxID=1260050 RepID=A0ABP0CBS1_9PEZI
MRPPQVCSLASQASTVAAWSTVTVNTASRTSCRLTASFPPRAAWTALRTPALGRSYATQHQRQPQSSSSSSSASSSSSSASRRRSVTPFNDDGHVPWSELSGGEKTARAAQQTFNLGMVVVGVVLTGGVCYFLFTEVFSPNSKVSSFNRAVDRIKADHRITDLLGDSRKIIAHGEETANKWRRARPIASTERTDSQGEHLVMQFHVEGPRAEGMAYLHLLRRPGQSEFVYQYFYVDVPGHDRIYLEKSVGSAPSDKKGTLFGIKWA